MPKALQLEGQRFGRLTVIARVPSSDGKSSWLCRCDCGKEKIVRANNLKRNTVSCGCYQKEVAAKVQTVHGMAHTNIYSVWEHMKRRCHDTKSKDFKNYGGRGIEVCQEWSESFQAFYAHVSVLPHFGEPCRSLDRIDNNGNYEPGNVRWATRIEQRNNQRPRKRGTSCK